jgi:DNA-binding PadR family transcriptional regulator
MPRSLPPPPSPLALTVLFMLLGGPLHPYEMQRRMKLWGKERVVNLTQRASLYKTIDRLQQAGLIAVHGTERDQRFPERTVYELTEAGLRVGREWELEMLDRPVNEYPRFPAALSFILGLEPDEARAVLEHRAAMLQENLAQLERALAGGLGKLPPRVTQLDSDYLRAITAAELNWVRRVIDELRTGKLTWSYDELAASVQAFLSD